MHQPEFWFFAGGQDLEMVTLCELVQQRGLRLSNYKLPWGARLSDYRAEYEEALNTGFTPVLIELKIDLPLRSGTILIDHHGERSGRDQPSSLRQVFDLLGLPPSDWTREFELVEANDIGHIRQMKSIGATQAEVKSIRLADRRAQGVSESQEKDMRMAISCSYVIGSSLRVIRLVNSNRTAAVADLASEELGGPGFDNLFVLGCSEIGVFGQGDLINHLNKKYPGGWWGGALPERGFWGYPTKLESVLDEILGFLGQQS